MTVTVCIAVSITAAIWGLVGLRLLLIPSQPQMWQPPPAEPPAPRPVVRSAQNVSAMARNVENTMARAARTETTSEPEPE